MTMGARRAPTQTTSTTQTTRLDPATEAYVSRQRELAEQGAHEIRNQPGSYFAGMTPEQLQAMEYFGNPVSFGLGGYNPRMVGAPGIDFSIEGSGIGRALLQGGGVSGPGQFNTARISDFMDPYEGAVVAGAQKDFANQRNAALTRAAQEATAAGAFGGSRSALLQAQALRDINDSEERRLAELRSAGYSQALGAGLTEWQTQAQLGTQASIANQAAMLQMLGMEQNQAMAMAQMMLQSDLANQGADLQAFGIRSQNATNEATLNQQRNQSLFNMGEVSRALTQQQLQEPLWRNSMALQMMNLGLGPFGTSTSGTSTQQQTGGGGFNWPGLLLGAAQIAAPFFLPGIGGLAAGAATRAAAGAWNPSNLG